MVKLFITGFSGFVNYHYLNYLEDIGDKVEVLGVDLNFPEFDLGKFINITVKFTQLNMLDKNALESLIKIFQPTQVIHLASYSSVAYSWKHPTESFLNNTNIFLNLIESIRKLEIKCRVLSIGSSEEYGKVIDHDIPLSELGRVNPISPYAVARVSQEMLGKIYVEGYGMDIVFTRSFNHVGPFQKDKFVIAAFAKQIVSISLKQSPAKMKTGNLSIIRDFVDVRDVVRAYWLLLQKGTTGEVYNICSGKGVELREIINLLCEVGGVKPIVETDPALVRPDDNPLIVGSYDKIKAEVQWVPEIPLSESIRDIFNYWKKKAVS
jgi:GDP-4-dehydro-6-deoxy-D-mannose reductase